jgi:hypothetical protein
MKKLITLLFLLASHQTFLFAQSIGINNTGASPHVSAILDIQSTDKGLLIPRMTQAQRFAIPSPANGLMVYQTDQEKGFYYNFSTPLFPVWKKVGADALPPGMIILSDSFPNSVLESNGFSPHGALQNISMATYGDNGRWTPASTTNMLELNGYGYAVWTGTEVLYWQKTSGKRYNPATDVWTNIPDNALFADRTNPSVIWTGTEMIVWGGQNNMLNYVNTGARYNPSTNTWQAISTVNAPSGRKRTQLFMNGAEVIFFGGDDGYDLCDGAKYNPASNMWTAIATANGPGDREDYSLVWTGNKLIVWGGRIGQVSVNTGCIYTPATNSWAPMPTLNAPSTRNSALSGWTGTELLIWGGEASLYDAGCQCYLLVDRSDGAKFNLNTFSWSPISNVNDPSSSAYYTEFAGGRWFLFKDGGKSYDPVANTWTDIPNAGVQPGQYGPFVVKTMNDQVFVWGSSDDLQQTLDKCHSVGGIWDPATNTWVKMINSEASPVRNYATPIWTGTEMIISSMPKQGDPPGIIRTSRYNPSQQGFGGTISKTLYLYKKI